MSFLNCVHCTRYGTFLRLVDVPFQLLGVLEIWADIRKGAFLVLRFLAFCQRKLILHYQLWRSLDFAKYSTDSYNGFSTRFDFNWILFGYNHFCCASHTLYFVYE